MAIVSERSLPSDGRLLTRSTSAPGIRMPITVDPPPSRLVESTAPTDSRFASSPRATMPAVKSAAS